MSTNRFLTLLTIIAVMVVVAFSIREAVATSNVAPEMDSATRSYIAWGNALRAANKEGVMVPVTVYSDASNSEVQPLIAWAKACGVDLSYANNVELDSATRSLISRAMSVKCGNIP